ncbi:sulfotransferase family protein [Marinactinospora thermotolerans]|uniref:Sulfotransferase domain-containing protein n=1 Tax=Marinactinospora thermotolerans DSM 45154 TaxID=1122192 RepID=A0A1T4SYP4_9ACTN|nr:sulfotransferase [Marinactinospora thermotolerans]SKA33366.1 Sulfotransferase domain-containing protein [Marinactinospora thermotolerans DSM 45154]
MSATLSIPPAIGAPLQRTARSASGLFGQATRSMRVLPTFLIVGAQRCGTTSLFKALLQHPDVLGPTLRKGVHYFDTGYDRGSAWYRGHFPTRSRARDRQVGESSPYYMFHPLAAERIARGLPGIKVIVALRDPVERAYSAHVHESARGFETEPFERALELEEERLRGEEERLRAEPWAYSHSHQHHGYLARGRYADQLARLEKHLGRGRMHVVDSEEFFERPEETFARIEDFLGLPHHSDIRFERHNARPRAGMDPVLRARLTEYFEPHDERLAHWWGRTPSWRR